MMREEDILYQVGSFWVCKAPNPNHGFEVYRDGATHATRCAIIGYTGEEGLAKAKAEADRRAKDFGEYVAEVGNEMGRAVFDSFSADATREAILKEKVKDMQKDDYAAMAANTMAKHQYRCLVDTPELEVWECKRPDMGLMESFNLIIQTTGMAMIGDYDTVTFRVGARYGLPFLSRDVDSYYCEKLCRLHEHEREYDVEKALGHIGWLAEVWLERVELMPREGEKPIEAVARMAAEVKSMTDPHASELYDFADLMKEARRQETDREFYDLLRSFTPVEFDEYPNVTSYTGNFLHRLHMIRHAAQAILEIKNNQKKDETHGS